VMRLRWSPEAADDLEGIVKYIARDNPEAGREVALKIREGLMGLRTFPYGACRTLGRKPGVRGRPVHRCLPCKKRIHRNLAHLP
jgi:plasmid stabilization system protein ParE